MTSVVTVQMLPAGIVPPLKLTKVPPDAAPTSPPQDVDVSGDAALTNPPGYVSEKATPVSASS